MDKFYWNAGSSDIWLECSSFETAAMWFSMGNKIMLGLPDGWIIVETGSGPGYSKSA